MSILSKTMCRKYSASGHSSLDGRYRITIYDAMDDMEEDWALVAEGKDIFFSPEFLRVVEKFPASGIKPFYGIVYDEDRPAGILYFQSRYVRLAENLRNPGDEEQGIFRGISSLMRKAVVRSINFETVVCGNLMVTGRYGFCFNDTIARDEQFYLVIKSTEVINKYLTGKDIKPGLVLIKDFFEEDVPSEGEYHKGFTKFSVQPKMILEMDPSWHTFDDYLDAMKSKYRVRARNAIKKSADITRVIFDETDIANHRETIHSLYRNVSDQADFNAFILHQNYFEKISEALGKNMRFTTYWRKGRMVAFFTSIRNYDILDAHFLGYEPAENAECQLYLNMLYDLVREAIDIRATKVDLSRTAVEIKSTVGAVPHEMYLYLRHTNPLLNKAVETVLSFVKPTEEYVIRSPFREEKED
jgi:hypothetical protein